MAGINRLGKAPPRPGSLRPPDPNRNKVLDVFSEGTEGDADYMRMVQDIEDTQGGQSGWLFGRGAFDKGDLLYLRDEEEKKRFKEEELRDSERMQFLRMQATTGPPKNLPASLPLKAPNPDRAPPKPHSKVLAGIVRVKGGKAGAAPAKRAPTAEASAGQPKRPRAESPPSAQAPHAQNGAAQHADGAEQDDSDAEPGLAGLLGEYGSDEEDNDSPAAAAADGSKQDLRRPAALPPQSGTISKAAGKDAGHSLDNQSTKAAEEEAVDYD